MSLQQLLSLGKHLAFNKQVVEAFGRRVGRTNSMVCRKVERQLLKCCMDIQMRKRNEKSHLAKAAWCPTVSSA